MISNNAPDHGRTLAERQMTFLAGSSALYLYPAPLGIPQPQLIFQEGFVTLCCELIKFTALLVAAHLLIPVIFKPLNSEGLGRWLQRPFAVLHPVETIEVISLLWCARSYLT